MTEQELLDEITLVSTAISNLMKTGQEYEVGTGQSKRIFKMVDLDKLRDYRRELQRDLNNLAGEGSGMVLQF